MHAASKITNLIQIGVRSMSAEEKPFIDSKKCYMAKDMYNNAKWYDTSIKQMSSDVYLTIDLDVFDPSFMPSTGTPEPGGIDWYTALQYLKKVFMLKNVVGFDIVEFAPIQNLRAPDFLVAKLYYTLLSYKFRYNISKNE
jgi:agmatinase